MTPRERAGWEGRAVARYRLVRRVGRGGMGEVYLATLEPLPGVKKLAAVKLLRDVGLDAGAERGLAAEARLAALITHPNVVQLLDAGVEDETPWIAMEFVAGLSLHELLVTTQRGGSGLPPWVVARILADACAGLHAVHEARNERGEPLGIVHRDVTPHNVLISWDGSVKITDFGVARCTLQATATQAGVVKGKLSYMAPEQAAGARVDRRTDVFALGVLLFEALSGKKPFQGENATETLARVLRCEVPRLSELAPQAPPELCAIAERALQADPAARHPTARDMQRALESALRAVGVDVGSGDVADVIAALVPERVAEHEAWLREHDASASTSPETGAPLVMAAAERARASRPRRPLWVGLGLVALAGGAALVWARGAPPTARLDSGSRAVAARLGAVGVASGASSAAPPPAPSRSAPAQAAAPSPLAPAPARVETGQLHVASTPVWAKIFVDGRAVGATPIAGLAIPAGTHVVEARAQGRSPSERRVVSVPARGSISVHFSFPSP